VLEEGVHSGDAGGIVPSSFRLARRAISRLEDEATGEIFLPEFKDEIPPDRTNQAKISGQIIGRGVYTRFPFVGLRGECDSAAELILNRTWRSALEVTGASGLPSLEEAGNVLRPETTLKLSIRIPPRVDPEKAALALKRRLESTQEPGTRVEFSTEMLASGWNSPSLSPWLEKALESVSIAWFERPAVLMGEGGTIPFMGMLGKRYPRAQFVITGVLGPGSNAHGPNEFLHIPTAKKLTGCIAQILKIHLNAISGDCEPPSS
jgi:acetylornithine deacetylase/succinyl-diaminopimelate desuccinylase-like protein